jgi:hypothetical protein
MKELNRITIVLIILILVFLIITNNLLEPPKEKNVNSLHPTFNNFNMIFWSIICFLSSFPFIFCILRYSNIKDSDRNQ